MPEAQPLHSLRIGLVGPGRLGAALAGALVAAGYAAVRIATVAGHDPAPPEHLSTALALPSPEPLDRLAAASDLLFLTVPDAAVAPVAALLPALLPARGGLAVVHCSGALGLDALGAAARAGAVPGTLHPLQTFPGGEPPAAAARRFAGIVCGVEAAEPLGATLEGIAADLGARSVRLEGVDRAGYHAAAVLASNDVVALMAAARRAWTLAGLPAEAARGALAPLMLAAAANVEALPLERALTGPVARGDVATVERHLAALAARPALRELYRRLALELLALDLGHDAGTTRALRALLAPGD
jgi:predicted short-subunit dehydrogenase-like oxidoreductase (DUF2520 family)